jgi:hypothetical protein
MRDERHELKKKNFKSITQYGAFLQFENPFLTFNKFEGFPHVIFRNMGSGRWNISFICNRLLDFQQSEDEDIYSFCTPIFHSIFRKSWVIKD